MAAHWEESVKQCFGIDKVFDHQKYTLHDLLTGRDAFLSVCTGGGKSLCYMAYPVAAAAQHERTQCGSQGNELVIVVTPLTAIMLEQCEMLNAFGFKAACLGHDESQENDIMDGKFQFIFTSPESILENVKWREMLRNDIYQNMTGLIVIDEAHTVTQWGQASQGEDQPFRIWFARLGELRCLLPKATMLALTATASKSSRQKIKDLLRMKSCTERAENPDRPNIKLFIKHVNSSELLSETFGWCTNILNIKKEACPRMLIFCKSINDCSKLYVLFKMRLPKVLMCHVSMFHSQTPERTKEKLRLDMSVSDGLVRVLVCTSAAGMGVNYAGISHVVNYGPPQELDTFLQQQGRAGRSGEQSYNVIIFNNRQLRNLSPEMLDYIRNDEACRRTLLLSFYASKPTDNVKHRCCDICEKQCDCVPDGACASDTCIPVFADSVEDSESDSDNENASTEDAISDAPQEVLRCLTTSLKEYQRELSLQANSGVVVNPELIHGLTDDIITTIVKKCTRLRTPDDLLANCDVSCHEQASQVCQILRDILDIDRSQAGDDDYDYTEMDD